MRVISGSAKGIQLQAVPGSGTRPISDRVKEAVFNILGDAIVESRVLDLFAGTGSVGIEALSRGAEQAVFVEKHPKAIATIRANLRRTALEAEARVVRADVFKFLASTPQPFDLIYIAPPQYQGLWSKTLLALDAVPEWLDPNGPRHCPDLSQGDRAPVFGQPATVRAAQVWEHPLVLLRTTPAMIQAARQRRARPQPLAFSPVIEYNALR